MTVTYFEELARSRDTVIDLRSGSTTFVFMALVYAPYDVSDDQDVIAHVEDNTTLRYGNQLRRTIATKSLGGPAWEVTLTYGFDEGDAVPVPPGDPLPYEFTFDTTGGTQHVTQSLATVSSVKYGQPVETRTVDDLVTVGPRTVTDAVTTLGSNVLTSATAIFGDADVGAALSSTTAGMLPVNCTIASVTSTTAVKLSGAALSTQAAGNLTIKSVVLSSSAAAFVAPGTPNPPRNGDVGAGVSSLTPGLIPDGAVISKVLSATQAQISGGTLGSTQANVQLTISGLKPVNYNRAIGVSREGVAGTDVTAPKLEFQMVRNFVGMTLTYIRTCHLLTGCVNDAPFFGYEAGELLFLGASGAPSQNNTAVGDPLCRVTFRFAGSPNKEDLDLVPDDDAGNHLLRVDKRGWEYLWVFYKDDVDPVSKTMRPRPDAAYVEQVYAEADFSQLLIGTGV